MANKATKPVRVRIPPSPTGELHVGTARTALFNELFARHEKGIFILRIEDTDRARAKPEYEQHIIEGLQWLGIAWDEGPYRQSERTELYTQALEHLLEQGKAYYCSCPAGQPCTCDHAATDPALPIRLRVEPQEIIFNDVVRGEVKTHTDSFGGSFVIARSLNDPLYHLAVVVDDAAMEITHVIRGDDHISNTPKHILLQRALGYPTPVYAHLPLLVDEKRRKLSKRTNDVSLLRYKDQGYLPEAMLNYLALLGWNPKTDQEFFTHEELIKAFTLEGVQTGSAVFSLAKLQAINKQHLRRLSGEELFERTRPFLEKAAIDTADHLRVIAALKTEQERVATLKALAEAIVFLMPNYQPALTPELLTWKKSTPAEAKFRLEKVIAKLETTDADKCTAEDLQKNLLAWIDEQGIGRGNTLWPMRVALSGHKHSPGPFEIAAVLGKDETLRRLHAAYVILSVV